MSSLFRPAVLVVEDEFLVMQDVAETLRDYGFEDVCARTGDEALPLLESRPDIRMVFTDINMPGRVDGVELAREIGRRWPNVEVILTSGRMRPDDAEVAEKWPFIPKPYDPSSVARRIRGILGLPQYRQ